MRRCAVLILLAALIVPFFPRPTLSAPWVESDTWIILDPDTGVILDAHDPYRSTATASLAKVMTALIASERGDLSQVVTIVKEDLIGEATANLEVDQKVTLRTLLHGLMMRSGNDAAMAIARAVGGSPDVESTEARQRFVGWMNEKARSLGLTSTHFQNPHGLDQDGHYSTAYDLAVITQAAIKNSTFLVPFGAKTYEAEEFEYKHGNLLTTTYPGLVGGKTGWTDNAGLCLIEVAERNGRELIVVLLHSTFEYWYSDAQALLDYGWSIPQPAISPTRANDVFEWWAERTDRPITSGQVNRSWIWGPTTGGGVRYESYTDAPGGTRTVQYFDKGRMEVNAPRSLVASGWYVTGGRLAWEMITGQVQVGDDDFRQSTPATVALAGDPGNDAATYADLLPLLNDAPAEAGTLVTERLLQNGTVVSDPKIGAYGVSHGTPVVATNHGVASVFQEFLDQSGPMWIDNAFTEAALFTPSFAVTGYPITEPYWLRVPIDGFELNVLVQCFERRCLTYAPLNPPGWRVEMSNIGQHYLKWRQSAGYHQSRSGYLY